MKYEHKAKYPIGPIFNSSQEIYDKLNEALKEFRRIQKKAHQVDYFISFLDSDKFAIGNSKIQNINVVAYIPIGLTDFDEELKFIEQELNKK